MVVKEEEKKQRKITSLASEMFEMLDLPPTPLLHVIHGRDTCMIVRPHDTTFLVLGFPFCVYATVQISLNISALIFLSFN